MAELYIYEFESLGEDGQGTTLQGARVAQTVSQSVTIGGASAQSSAFQRPAIRLKAGAACHVAFGPNPTATTSSAFFMDAGDVEYITARISDGWKLAVIQA